MRYYSGKVKVTKAKLQEWQEGFREYNKRNKRVSLPRVTFEQYIDILHGRVSCKQPFQELTVSNNLLQERITRERTAYRSVSVTEGNHDCSAKEVKQYSGERKLLGIATMHKSNAVPVFDKEQLVDISRMRRN